MEPNREDDDVIIGVGDLEDAQHAKHSRDDDVLTNGDPDAIHVRRRSSVKKAPTKSRKKNKKKQKSQETLHAIAATVQSEESLVPGHSMVAAPTARAVPLLICSIGNPGAQYANTLHSAGHTALNRLAAHLGYAPFSKEKSWGNGLVSRPPAISVGSSRDWTLWQSTAYMNESGKGVRAAYQAWNRNLSDGVGKLVVVHDELEKPLGAITVKTQQGLSARGHNGLKSIMSVIGNTAFVRIGVGIGRPASRQSDDVARYVLKKMDHKERLAIDGSVEELFAQLVKIESG